MKTKRAQDNNGERAMPPRGGPPRAAPRTGKTRGTLDLRRKLLLLTAAALWSILVVQAVFVPRNRLELQGDRTAEGGGVFACVGACGAALGSDDDGGDPYCKIREFGVWTTGDGVCVNADSTVPHGQGDGTYGNIGSFDVSKVTSMDYMFRNAQAFNIHTRSC